MRKYLLAAAAAVAIASPAAARDGAGYVGLEAGFLMDADIDFDISVDDVEFDDAMEIDFNVGQDIDVIGGYDFGMIRAEAELGYKRAKVQGVDFDEDLVEDEDFTAADFEGRMSVLSLMGNLLVDVINNDTHNIYVGGGFGRARVKLYGENDSAWAYQGIAGVRLALSDNFDVGLKYRLFQTMNLDYSDEFEDVDLNEFDINTRGKLTTHSLLLSLVYNFGPPPPPPAPVVDLPPPPPPAPATQTCPDGSVILATDVCPLPPAPPPPPPPSGERG